MGCLPVKIHTVWVESVSLSRVGDAEKQKISFLGYKWKSKFKN